MALNDIDDNKKRTAFYKKDDSLESVLKSLNEAISPMAQGLIGPPSQPIVLIMGCARSGSTVLMQYLISLGCFSYPSNIVARFYKNPYIGILAQQALLEFDPSNQLNFNLEGNFSSNLGKTQGALQPSEFWYFWREYFQFKELNCLNDTELSKIDATSFLSHLAAFEKLTNKPLVMKGMIANWHIPYLESIYSNFIFLNIERNTISNAQSLLEARKSFFNDIEKWYSFKPVEYSTLKDKSPIEQTVGQVLYTKKAVEKGLESVKNKNKITIRYEDFCQNPNIAVVELKNKFNELGFELNPTSHQNIESKIKMKSKNNLDDIELFERAVSKFNYE